MTDLAERTGGSTLVEERPAPSRRPPELPPTVPPTGAGRWPRRARVVIAALAAVAVIGTAGTIVGFTTGDDSSTVREQRESIEQLTIERDSLVDRAAELEAAIETVSIQRTDLADRTDDLDAAIEELRGERDDLVAELATDSTLDAVSIAVLDAQVAELDRVVDDLVVARDGLATRVVAYESLVAQLRADLAGATAVSAELDALEALFPMQVSASLVDLTVSEIAGTYDVTVDEVFCTGFTGCGTDLAIDELDLVESTDGYLQVEIDDVLTTMLHRVDGALYGVADAMPDAAACGATERVARTSITIFPRGMSIDDAGAAAVTSLAATLTMEAAPAGTCGASIAFHGLELTPAS